MKRAILFSILALAVVSCSKEKTMNGEMGCISLGLNLENSTKASMTAAELLSTAQVKIYYADYSGLVQEYVYGQMPEKIYLPASEYRVDVYAGECVKENPRIANFEQISYKGSETFTIEGGSNSTVTVEAGVYSTVSKVVFDKTVDNNLNSGYTLSIGTDDSNKIVYDSSNNGTPGYFLVAGIDDPQLSWTFSGTRKKNGEAVSKSGVIKNVEKGKAYELTIKYTLREGDVDFNIYVDTSMKTIKEIIVFDPVSTGLVASSKYEIWAGHATVHADVDEEEYRDPSKIFFEYTADGTSWSKQQAKRVEEGTYEATLTGLKASTTYSYRLAIDGAAIGDPLTFETESAPAVPNGDMEEITKLSGKSYYEFYNPSSSDPLCRTAWWGSGNGSDGISGSADMGYVICEPDASEKVSGSRSARLQSAWAVVKFAAGNLFTGHFGGLVGTKGGLVYFGRPFTARPTGIKFWAKYSTGKVNRIDDSCPYPVSTSDYDKCRVLVALGNWTPKEYGGTKESPVLFNTTVTSTLIDFNKDKCTLACGELILQGDSNNSCNVWKEYTVKFDYKDTNNYPQYIIISCASSMYGDYFTGCDSSKLWLDKMEFIYD